MPDERPASRPQRIFVVIGAWVVGAPFAWMLFLMMGVWSLLVVIPALWATWDYLSTGGMVDSVDRVSRMGAFLPGAWKRD